MKTRLVMALVLLMSLLSCERVEVLPTNKTVEGGEEVQFAIKEEWKVSRNNSVLWEFGDGVVSSEREPTHVYTSAGNFTVTVSVFSRSGRLKRKFTPYIVNVSQFYKPRVIGLSAETENLDYLYKDLDTYLYALVSQEVADEISDYSFEMTINNSDQLYGRGNGYIFQDTGYHDVSVKIYDANGVSGTFDTTLHVGGEMSYLRFSLNDANLGSLGTIAEKYLIIYRNTSSIYYSGDKSDFLDYPGPGVTAPLINNGQLMSYYGPGSNDYFYWDFEPWGYISLGNVSDGDIYQIAVTAHDGSYADYDNLRAFHLVVGSNGINLSELPITDFVPGLTTELFDLPTPVFYSY